MLLTSSISLLISTLLLAPTLAVPTRTHCRCTIVSDIPSLHQESPSSAHWAPSDPVPGLAPADICSTLGPELENFQHTEPHRYTTFTRKTGFGSPNPAIDAQRPLSTTVLLDVAARQGLQTSQHHEEEKEPRPTSRPGGRIVCHSEAEPFSAYNDSFVTLWALRMIIAAAVFACAGEGVHLALRWINNRYGSSSTPSSPIISETSRSLYLPGAERLLCAFPAVADPDSMFSPGAEKKSVAYLNFVAKVHCEKREFIAYDEEDDEADRPVM